MKKKRISFNQATIMKNNKLNHAFGSLSEAFKGLKLVLEEEVIRNPGALSEASDQDLLEDMFRYENEEKFELAAAYKKEFLRRGKRNLQSLK